MTTLEFHRAFYSVCSRSLKMRRNNAVSDSAILCCDKYFYSHTLMMMMMLCNIVGRTKDGKEDDKIKKDMV